MHLILDLGKGKGGKLWLGGHCAGKDSNFMINSHDAVVWPANRTSVPQDTAALRVLPWMDGTGVTHGDVPLDRVLNQVRCSGP